ncbi:MAG: TIGR02611 family protein [Candidatus Saccharimonadales bacterium]
MSLKRGAKKVLTGIVGGVVLLAGIMMIPYPGPGWAVVFIGLGILSTEFEWAHRVLEFAKDKYDAWANWVAKQSNYVKFAIGFFTAVVVVVTIWLFNGYGFINDWLNLKQDWVNSPLFG